MNPKEYLTGRYYKTKVTNCVTSSGSSNYSTCSDNPSENANMNKDNLGLSMQSTVLAGQIQSNEEEPENTTVMSIDAEKNYSINILDQNLDVLMEDDDVFMDCTNVSKSDLSENDSTKYIPLASTSQLDKMKSDNYYYNNFTSLNNLDENEVVDNESNNKLPDTVKLQTEQERLRTIMEETEITHPDNLTVKSLSSINIGNSTGGLVVEMIDQFKRYKETNDSSKNIAKKVLFANRNSIINKDDVYKRTNQSKLKKQEKNSNPLVGKVNHTQKEDTNKNCNYHNTTESFVKWEKFCRDSENLSSRRSLSYSELNSLTDSYGGDDEYSTSFKTLNDSYVSSCSIETVEDETISRRKLMRHRSKSCDSLLREVKHLPHIVYDRFLKTLSREIEYMRKQTVVCTCQRRSRSRKHSSKENKDQYLKTTVKPTKIINEKNAIKETKLSVKVSPLKVVTNKRELSPEILSKNSSQNVKRLSPKSSSQTFQNVKRLSPRSPSQTFQNVKRLSPKSPSKTPTASAKRLYSWHKEIKSPVGEYIKGRSPFKSSPTKKKV